MKSYPGGLEDGIARNELISKDFFMNSREEFMKQFFAQSQPKLMERILQLLGAIHEDYAAIFKAFHQRNDAFKVREELYRPVESGFNALCHGDLWFNNLLFT